MFKKFRENQIYFEIWFIGLGTLGMIIWTTVMAMKAGAGLDEDSAFLSNYHTVDKDFNKIVAANKSFESKYNVKFIFNDKEITGLTYKDIYLGQRAIAKRKIRKNLINIGKNSLTVFIQDKKGKSVDNKTVDLLLTQAITHDNDINLKFKNSSKKEFDVEALGYWNITGVIEVDDQKGYFYIKTNAKK